MATKTRSSKATHTEPKDFGDDVIELASRDEIAAVEDTLPNDEPSPIVQGPRMWVVSGQTVWGDVHAVVEALTAEDARMQVAQSFMDGLYVTPRAT